MLIVYSKTFRTSNAKVFITTLALGICLLLSACSSDSSPILINDAIDATAPNAQLSNNPAIVEASYADKNDPIEDTRIADASADVPAVSSLQANIVRAGLASLEWASTEGDTHQTHTTGDSVSYYRVYRDGEFFVDTLSSYFEDASSPTGQVEYAVEAHKFVGAPQYTILRSVRTALIVNVPSFADDAQRFSAQLLSEAQYKNQLDSFKTCTTSISSTDGSELCSNGFGYSWQQFNDGRQGDLSRNTTSVTADYLVSVRNTEAELGIAPGVPTLTVKSLSSGESTQRNLDFGDEYLNESEGHVVNGVAVSDDGTAYISGTLYQSYLPRNLAIEAGVIPVTNAYYIVQIDISTASIIQFKRFTLAEAPGVAATVSNGVLEMHKLGQVSLYDTTTLNLLRIIPVSGYPVFADDHSVYTRSYNPAAFYQFERTSN